MRPRSAISNTLRPTIKAKLDSFDDLIIKHPLLTDAFDALINAITFAHPSSIIFVFGPTGVGKTTLLEKTYDYLLRINEQSMKDDLGYIPVLSYSAIAPDSGNFNWKDYYIRALEAAKEPMITNKSNQEVANLRRELHNMHISYRYMSTIEYRKAYELCIAHRRPEAIIIDEAQHLQKLSSGKRLLDQMDTIKSLADTTQTKHILIGTYELLELANLSAQLNRRTVYIHFPRYQHYESLEYNDFKGAVKTFQNRLEFNEEADLLAHSEYLYRYSAGCIGILKQWISRAYAFALQEESKTLLLKHLNKAAIPPSTFYSIAKEIRDGEGRLSGEMENDISSLLGMLPSSGSSENCEHRPSRGKPGKRKPVRDAIGLR